MSSVFYGCDWCHQERSVESEADIPLGHLCSPECRDAFVADQDARDEAAAAAGGTD